MKKRASLKEKLDPPRLDLSEDLDEKALFQKAMEGVRPLSRTRPAGAGRPIRPNRPLEKAAEKRRPGPSQEFVSALDRFDWFLDSEYSEYIEGGERKWDRRLMRKLRRGEFSVQAQLDLHGFHQQEARRRVEAFLSECASRSLHCVRIIHGKGNHSPNQVPVLKRRLEQWLSLRRNSRHVVAYASAPPVDGGVGATYVLLRRPRRAPKRP